VLERPLFKRKLEKLYRLYLEGGLSVQGFRERNDPLEKRKGELLAEIPRLQGEIDFLTIRKLGSAEVLAEAESLYERWETLAFGAKREIVETIVGKITVRRWRSRDRPRPPTLYPCLRLHPRTPPFP
jgi:hypothetical protein